MAVFSHAAEEIRFFKKQQWLVTSYALTAFFALALAPQYIGACEKVEIWSCVLVNFLCAIVVLVTAIAALIVLWSLDEAHQKELNRMNAGGEAAGDPEHSYRVSVRTRLADGPSDPVHSSWVGAHAGVASGPASGPAHSSWLSVGSSRA